ncbi:MAG: hypothetical protein ACKVT1_10400 [Dehalococcoidia bacterium]
MTTAALLPGAAVFAYPGQVTCPGPPAQEEFALLVRNASLIVIGTVSGRGSDPEVTDRGWLDLRPEAFLKGNPSASLVRFETAFPEPCLDPGVVTGEGARLLLIATGEGGHIAWPAPRAIYALADGEAHSLNRGDRTPLAETDLIARIRGLTDQYSVPAASAGEGSGIDWVRTVLPVGGATLALLAVGLLLMRVWHRIDPS